VNEPKVVLERSQKKAEIEIRPNLI